MSSALSKMKHAIIEVGKVLGSQRTGFLGFLFNTMLISEKISFCLEIQLLNTFF